MVEFLEALAKSNPVKPPTVPPRRNDGESASAQQQTKKKPIGFFGKIFGGGGGGDKSGSKPSTRHNIVQNIAGKFKDVFQKKTPRKTSEAAAASPVPGDP